MTIRILSLALAAATAFTASTAAFSEDTPNQIRLVHSRSWGTGCPQGSVRVTFAKRDLTNDTVYNLLSITYLKNAKMKVKGDTYYLDRKSRYCTTKMTFRVPAGYTLGRLTGDQAFITESNNRMDEVFVKNRLDVSDFNLLDPVRRTNFVRDPNSTRDISLDFGQIGDLDDAFCHDDRYATITLRTDLIMEYELLENSPPLAYAQVEGPDLYFDIIDDKTNAVKCNAASGWRWF